MLGDGGRNFRARHGIKLVEEENGRARVLAPTAFRAQFVADFAASYQNSPGVVHFTIRHQQQEARLGELFDRRTGVRVPQHALRRKDNQRLAPRTPRLAAQHVEILSGGGGLANLHVVFGGELHKAFEAGAGMLRPLPFITMRQKHHDSGGQVPFVFARADELVDDHLGAVGKVAELGLPENKRLGIVAAEAVFESYATRFGKRRIVDLAERLVGRKMAQRQIDPLRFRINQDSVARIECAAFRVLDCEADGRAFEQQGAESQRFRKAVVDRALSVAHFRPLLEQFHNLRMSVEAFRDADQAVSDLREFFLRQAGVHCMLRLVTSVEVRRPIFGQLAKLGNLSEGARFDLFFFVFVADFLGYLRRVNADGLRVNLPKRRMVFDALVEFRLGNRGVINFAVAVTAVANNVDNDVAAKRGAILRGEFSATYDGVRTYAVHVENRDGLTFCQVRSKARGMFLIRSRREGNEIVHDDVNCAADGVGA